MLSFPMTLNNPQPEFQGHITFQKRLSQDGAFPILRLQLIHLLNLQCNVPLMRASSAIDDLLVSTGYILPKSR